MIRNSEGNMLLYFMTLTKNLFDGVSKEFLLYFAVDIIFNFCSAHEQMFQFFLYCFVLIQVDRCLAAQRVDY